MRTYDIRVRNDDGAEMDYIVKASTDEAAVAKAKKQAGRDMKNPEGWRCTQMREIDTRVI